MSNRIYPNWDQINKFHDPLTEGEHALIKYLDKNLPIDTNWNDTQKLTNYKGWLIFVQPYLNGNRPDIIIFNPYVGMTIYEVKDWNLDLYKWKRQKGKKKLFVKDNRGEHEIKSPILQVRHYKNTIIGQLVPSIGEAVDKNRKKFGLIKTALYFHKERTKKVKQLFPDNKIINSFGYDYLDRQKIAKIAPYAKLQNSKYWNRKWNKNLLFWLKPPTHSIEQGEPLKLKKEQKTLAEPKPGHHRCRGVAGSGKTLALAYRAARLSSQGKQVLILTYNITLQHYIKDIINRVPAYFKWSRIKMNHFHGFCSDVLNKLGAKWPDSPDEKEYKNRPKEYEKALEHFFRHTVPNSVANAIKTHNNYEKYDAVLIDEGQDFYIEWYQLLDKYFLTSRDEVLVVCDKKQNIYNRKLDWVDKRINREGLEKFTDPYITITTTFRMPDRVAELSDKFSRNYKMNQDINITRIEKTAELFNIEHIIWVNIKNVKNEWKNKVYDAYRRLKYEEYHPSDMVILLPDHQYGSECVDHFKKHNIEVNHVFGNNRQSTYNKKSFWMGDSRLKMSTIHSFKGWEIKNIVLFISDDTYKNYHNLDAIVYTAITRTRENLIVINANDRYKSFGKNLPKKWDEMVDYKLL